MKRTFKSSITFVLLALLVSPVFGQPKQGDRDRRSDRGMLRDVPPEIKSEVYIAVFDEYFDLSNSQVDQIKVVDEEFALKGKELKEEKVNRRKKMVMAKELRDDHQKAIHQILTKEQYAIYLDKKEAIQYDIRQRLKDHVKDGE